MQTIIVSDQARTLEFAKSFAETVDATEYLTSKNFANSKTLRVINLSASYKYQSLGYYVSLLAEARQHKVLPSITTMQDLKNPSLAKLISLEIGDEIQESLRSLKSKDFILSVYFGKNIAKRYDKLSRQLHKLFPSPLFRVHFHFEKKWRIKHIAPISITDIPPEHHEHLLEFARAYFTKQRFHAAKLSSKPFDLAILINPDEKVPPSDKKAIQKFIEAGEAVGFDVDLVTKEDFKNISEYDALFIRETTSVNHHTYRFARRATADGLVVIDDPESILKCTNKVYLTELLQKHKIRSPNTYIVSKRNKSDFERIAYPCVLKLPDSSFSQGVIKVEDKAGLKEALVRFFDESDLILVQDFMPTDYDWRIGILDRKPLFACRYYMAEDHWQIYNWEGSHFKDGSSEAVSIDEVPQYVLNTALRATQLIGDGFYGVDIKQKGKDAYVIEINDNPSVEHGVEDELLGAKLYEAIMLSFLQRVKKRHGY